jgi:hypothetical protein
LALFRIGGEALLLPLEHASWLLWSFISSRRKMHHNMPANAYATPTSLQSI